MPQLPLASKGRSGANHCRWIHRRSLLLEACEKENEDLKSLVSGMKSELQASLRLQAEMQKASSRLPRFSERPERNEVPSFGLQRGIEHQVHQNSGDGRACCVCWRGGGGGAEHLSSGLHPFLFAGRGGHSGRGGQKLCGSVNGVLLWAQAYVMDLEEEVRHWQNETELTRNELSDQLSENAALRKQVCPSCWRQSENFHECQCVACWTLPHSFISADRMCVVLALKPAQCSRR